MLLFPSFGLSFFSPAIPDNYGHCKDGLDPYCLQCGPHGTSVGCKLCAVSYVDKDSLICKTPEDIIEHCGTYDPHTKKCVDCQKGYFMSQSGFCVKHKLDGCINPLSSSECRECERFMLTDEGLCDVQRECVTMGCSTCKYEAGKEVCVKCRKGYIFNIVEDAQGTSQSCILEYNHYKGCAVIKNDKCIGCRFGHFVHSHIDKTLRCSKSPVYESEFVVKFRLIAMLALVYFF